MSSVREGAQRAFAPSTEETDRRLAAVRTGLEERGYDGLLVFGNNKIFGSLYYLSGYYPDRAGWISLGPQLTRLFEGAALVVPRDGEPTLILDDGLTLTSPPYVDNVVSGGFTLGDGGLTPKTLARALGLANGGRVGIETWERFPAALYLGLTDAMPDVTFTPSTIVEEQRLVKSPFELEVLSRAARVGDQAHQAVVDALRASDGTITELELIREAEHVMRRGNPVYEDGCSSSPSMIGSGTEVVGHLLHPPQPDKRIATDDIVHWDLCMRHAGYGIDTSRTRHLSEPTTAQLRAYEVILDVHHAVVDAARPGALSSHLGEVARAVTADAGLELWGGGFLGHGTGIDAHERPDMGVESIPLQENMVLALEPRLVAEGGYLIGNEDVVVVTPTGGRPLNAFPKDSLALDS